MGRKKILGKKREGYRVTLPPDLIMWIDQARGDVSRSIFTERIFQEIRNVPTTQVAPTP